MSDKVSRFAALDGLRTIAVALIVLYHCLFPRLPGGSIGVLVFFVISGFVITRLLLTGLERDGHVALTRFYTDRLLRLWPALVVAALVVGIVTLVDSNWSADRHDTWVALIYGTDFTRERQNAHTTDFNTLWAHTWSLGVEFQFYLVWAPLIGVLAYLGLRKMRLVAVIGLLACGPVVGRLIFWHGTSSLPVFTNDPLAVSDQLLIGCAFAAWVTAASPTRLSQAQKAARFLVWPSALILAVVALHVHLEALSPSRAHAYYTVGSTMVALIALVIVATLILEPRHVLSRLLAHPALSWPGSKLSYGLYLWHYPILGFTLAAFDQKRNEAAPVTIFLSVVAAALSWRLVEQPINSRRHASRRLAEPSIVTAI